MNKSKLVFAILVAFVAISSCKKGEDDVVAPQITLISPMEGASQSVSDSIAIEFIVDDEDLHEFTVEILKINEGGSVSTFTQKGHSHDRNYHYTNKVRQTSTGNYKLEIVAEDHNGNLTKSATGFSLVE